MLQGGNFHLYRFAFFVNGNVFVSHLAPFLGNVGTRKKTCGANTCQVYSISGGVGDGAGHHLKFNVDRPYSFVENVWNW